VEATLACWSGTTQDCTGCIHSIMPCNASLYPNLSILLQVLVTLPVTTATAERSLSTLKRLKTYLRSSIMGDPHTLTGAPPLDPAGELPSPRLPVLHPLYENPGSITDDWCSLLSVCACVSEYCQMLRTCGLIYKDSLNFPKFFLSSNGQTQVLCKSIYFVRIIPYFDERYIRRPMKCKTGVWICQSSGSNCCLEKLIII